MVNGKKDLRLVSLEHTVNCRTQRTTSTATLAVQGLQVGLAGSRPGSWDGEVGLVGRNWYVYHMPQSGDTEFQWRRGDVTLKQVVPRGHWLSIPRPEIKVKQQHIFRQRGSHDVAAGLVMSYNTIQARTQLTGAIHSGPGRAYKTVVHLDSLKGAAATARAKLRHPLVHSLSATIYERRRPVLTAKSKPLDQLKVKVAFDQQDDQTLVSVTYVPRDGKRTELKANVMMDSLKSIKEVVLGLKWNF